MWISLRKLLTPHSLYTSSNHTPRGHPSPPAPPQDPRWPPSTAHSPSRSRSSLFPYSPPPYVSRSWTFRCWKSVQFHHHQVTIDVIFTPTQLAICVSIKYLKLVRNINEDTILRTVGLVPPAPMLNVQTRNSIVHEKGEQSWIFF